MWALRAFWITGEIFDLAPAIDLRLAENNATIELYFDLAIDLRLMEEGTDEEL